MSLKEKSLRQKAPIKLRTEPDEKYLRLSRSSYLIKNNNTNNSSNGSFYKSNIQNEVLNKNKLPSNTDALRIQCAKSINLIVETQRRLSENTSSASSQMIKKILTKHKEKNEADPLKQSTTEMNPKEITNKTSNELDNVLLKKTYFKNKENLECLNESSLNTSCSLTLIDCEREYAKLNQINQQPPQSSNKIPLEVLKIKNFNQALGQNTRKIISSRGDNSTPAKNTKEISSFRTTLEGGKGFFSHSQRSPIPTPKTLRTERPNTAKEAVRSSSVLEKRERPKQGNKQRCSSVQPTRPSAPNNFLKNIKTALKAESLEKGQCQTIEGKVCSSKTKSSSLIKGNTGTCGSLETEKNIRNQKQTKITDTSKSRESSKSSGRSNSKLKKLSKGRKKGTDLEDEHCDKNNKQEVPVISSAPKKISLVLYNPNINVVSSLSISSAKNCSNSIGNCISFSEKASQKFSSKKPTEMSSPKEFNPANNSKHAKFMKQDVSFFSVERSNKLKTENLSAGAQTNSKTLIVKDTSSLNKNKTEPPTDSINSKESKLSNYVTKIAPLGTSILSPSSETAIDRNKGRNVSAIVSKKRKPSPGERMISLKEERMISLKGERNISLKREQVKQSNKFIYYMSNLEYYYTNSEKSNYFSQLYKEHFFQTFQSLQYSKKLEHLLMEEYPTSRKIFLPRRPTHLGKKTMIFDLDETLIHCTEGTDKPGDIQIAINSPSGEKMIAGINIRPHASECLQALSQHFEIIIFTASHSCYANQIIDFLDPDSKFVHHRLFREHCYVSKDGVYIKDLRIFGDRDLSQIALVDNACYSFALQVSNGIPILPFYDSREDCELKLLPGYLLEFLKKDIRELNQRTFRLGLHSESETADEVLQKLFPD